MIKTPGGFRQDTVRGALEGCPKDKSDRGHSVLRAVPLAGDGKRLTYPRASLAAGGFGLSYSHRSFPFLFVIPA